MDLRIAAPDDAGDLIALFEAVYAETTFMLLEPGEATTDPLALAARIETGSEPRTEIWFVAEQHKALHGYVYGRRGNARRNRHSLYLVMAVRKAMWGRGIGSGLLEAIESWAASAEIHRLELTVMASNERAIAVYSRAGFLCEGTRRHSLRVNATYVDELWMGKLLTSSSAGDAPRLDQA
jgi:RimJ/RimL family protein N-acetyltransferase